MNSVPGLRNPSNENNNNNNYFKRDTQKSGSFMSRLFKKEPVITSDYARYGDLLYNAFLREASVTRNNDTEKSPQLTKFYCDIDANYLPSDEREEKEKISAYFKIALFYGKYTYKNDQVQLMTIPCHEVDGINPVLKRLPEMDFILYGVSYLDEPSLIQLPKDTITITKSIDLEGKLKRVFLSFFRTKILNQDLQKDPLIEDAINLAALKISTLVSADLNSSKTVIPGVVGVKK